MIPQEHYHDTRFTPDSRRETLWKVLTQYYFQKWIPPDGSVLELGAGYCNFINNIHAGSRIALDLWPGVVDYAAKGVQALVGHCADLAFVDDNSTDLIFASNLFEHLTKEEFSRTLDCIHSKLSARGHLIILQPNFRYAFREYFDDYTHVSVYTHNSLADMVAAHGFEIVESRGRFLPLTIKGRLPIHPLLIRLYLLSPYKFLGKQLLLIARRGA